MPIETSVEGEVVTFRVRGEAIARQIMEAVTAHFSRTPSRFALWDLRDAILSSIKAAEFETLIKKTEEYAEARGPGASTAIVTRPGADALLAKAYEARSLAMGSRVAIRFFADMALAQAWLQSAR